MGQISVSARRTLDLYLHPIKGWAWKVIFPLAVLTLTKGSINRTTATKGCPFHPFHKEPMVHHLKPYKTTAQKNVMLLLKLALLHNKTLLFRQTNRG